MLTTLVSLCVFLTYGKTTSQVARLLALARVCAYVPIVLLAITGAAVIRP